MKTKNQNNNRTGTLARAGVQPNGSLTFNADFVRETDNFRVFEECCPDGVLPIIGKFYIRKQTARNLGDKIHVTVGAGYYNAR